jgi:hypothetical protein
MNERSEKKEGDMSTSLKGGYLTLIQMEGQGGKRRRMYKKKSGAGMVVLWASAFALAVVGVAWLALETGALESLVKSL